MSKGLVFNRKRVETTPQPCVILCPKQVNSSMLPNTEKSPNRNKWEK